MLHDDAISRILNAFSGVDLGDPRREVRLQDVVEHLARKPDASIPAAMESEARLEASYRLMNNPKVSFEALIKGLVQSTAERARHEEEVLVLHDTTTLSPKSATTDSVGHLQTGNAGFFFHASLAVSAKELKRPLGVAHGQTIARKVFRKRKSSSAGGAVTARYADRESARWFKGVEGTIENLSGCRIIHVMDREGDSYELFSNMSKLDASFVVRCCYDRRACAGDEPWSNLRSLVEKAKGVLSREVPISSRREKTAPRARLKNPAREARMATLQFAAMRVTIPAPRYVRSEPQTLDLNLVRVWEQDPPPDQTAIEWLLYTTEPVSTPEQVARIVDIYRTRWLIEEFFKALKTGCAYEQREFESYEALRTLLALSLPIACELLWLRSRSREAPNAPATEVLTPTQLEVLKAKSERPLPENPTVVDALLAVARLGGHLKSNGPPGWQVLYRGMRDLLKYEAGWVAAMEHMAGIQKDVINR